MKIIKTFLDGKNKQLSKALNNSGSESLAYQIICECVVYVSKRIFIYLKTAKYNILQRIFK